MNKKELSKLFYTAAKETWPNRSGRIGEIIVPFDDFSGFRGIDVSSLLPGTISSLNFDGIGTKVEIAERMNNHSTMAYDLFAMVCDDAVIRGAEPVLIGTVLDVRNLEENERLVRQLLVGYVTAANETNVAIINGEVAELDTRIMGYGNFNYNWSATVLSFARKDQIITGREIAPGDAIIALREEGFRSNGLTLARKIFSEVYGENWHKTYFDQKEIGEQLLLPSRIYTRAIIAMTGGYDLQPRAVVHGLAHITGEGIPEKLSRTLRPSGYGAVLDSLFKPCSAMWLAQGAGSIMDDTAYSTWNMGQGMLVITPDVQNVLTVAQEYGIEAKVAGRVVEEKGITVVSEGLFGSGKELRFQNY